jgi:hypothetical protein
VIGTGTASLSPKGLSGGLEFNNEPFRTVGY